MREIFSRAPDKEAAEGSVGPGLRGSILWVARLLELVALLGWS